MPNRTVEDPDRISASIAAVLPEIVSIRHHLHQNPELSHLEEETSAFVAKRLTDLGIDDVKTHVGGYGVLGTLRGTGEQSKGKMIALRADMDALPIQETRDTPYRSCRPGVMHACGHDGHTSTLLGTAEVLAGNRDLFSGTVRFVFQPAEETVGGAWRMCEEGALEGVDAIVALHGWPGMEVGKIGVRSGPMMASSDTFDLTIRGRGAHAAQPHMSIDPIVVGAQIVTALQTIASREMSPTQSVVVTVAQFHAGTASNIIPDVAELKGTIRCLTEAHREEIPARIERLVSGICAGFRAEYGLVFRRGTPVTVNDAVVNQLVSDIGRQVLGEGNVVELEAPSMGAEDFAMYLQRVPGAMFRLGVGADMTPLHTPTYNFADDAITVGMELFTRTVLRFLGEPGA
jgi:amidohydrolase